jgi:hypothetical protein
MALAILFAARFVPQKPGDELWNVDSPWYRYLLRFDAGWYLTISRRGYAYNGDDLVQQPIVFFPLYPFIARAIAAVTGLPHEAALLIVSNVAILIAIPLTCKLIRDEYGDRVALYAIALLSFFPTALFFSTGYAESLLSLLIISFFLLLKRDRFFLAAACAGLAAATRPTGIVLALPLLWQIWAHYSGGRKRQAAYTVACIVIATSGLWLYVLYLSLTFHSPFAFITGQQAWFNESKVGDYNYPMRLLLPFRFLGSILRAGPYPISFDPWFFFSFFVLSIVFRKKLPATYTLFSLGILLLPYFAFGGIFRMRSFTRYAMLAFPVFIIMADLLKNKRRLFIALTMMFAALMFYYTVFFAQWYWAG